MTLTKEFINSNTQASIESIEKTITETDDLVSRAFTELVEADIVSDDLAYHEESLEYVDENNDRIALAKYAIFDDIVYLSWIWVDKYLHNNGIGKKLVRAALERIQSTYSVSLVYTLAKSDSAKHIFKEYYNFDDATETDHLVKPV